MPSGLEYVLAFPTPESNRVLVSLRIPKGGELELWMPVWTPGSYLVREYSRNVQDLTAQNETGHPLQITKTRKNRWAIQAEKAKSVTVTYTVYGRELSVRTNWIDDEFALLNGAPTFITVRGFENAPHHVDINLPKGWKGAWSSLAKNVRGNHTTFSAANLDELIDSPILAGSPEVHAIPVDGIPISLINAGDPTLWNGAEAAQHVQKIVETYRTMMGNLPFDRYLFLNCIVEGRGGLEHSHSSVLMSSRYAFRKRALYIDWLGLVSHEFFHVWNVKRLRPAALGPFDYENEVYTRSLWFAEGVTSYYTPLIPKRAGLTKSDELLDALSEHIEKLQTTPGRHHQSLEDSSFDTWIKLYRPDENSVNTTISYYVKGAVVAWLLDGELRSLTKGKQSLDDLIRLLFSKHANDTGYADKDIQAAAEEISGASLEPFFSRNVRGRDELDYQTALQTFGLRFKKAKPEPQGWMGVETANREGKLVITAVREGSPAQTAGLNAEDELLAIAGFRVDARTLSERLLQWKPGDKVDVLIARRDAIRTLSLVLAEVPASWKLEIDPDATPGAVKTREAWMG